MPGLLEGKAAAITGAVSGIGRAITLEYLRQGASVAVNHLGDEWSENHFKSMVEEAKLDHRLISVPGDISKPETAKKLIEETVKSFGKLDIFVSNAGVCKFADFLQYVRDAHMRFTGIC
jgi:L-rhamnose 1-dehydrogenase